MKRERIIIVLLLIIAFGTRLVMWGNTYLVGSDSPEFIQNAKLLMQGDFEVALSHKFHPLYSLLIGIVAQITSNYETAGYLVSVLLGSLIVIPIFLIGKTVFDIRIAVFASVLFIFNPYTTRLSADIMSEMSYLFFFMMAVWLFLEGTLRQKLYWFWLGAIFSGLAYLTRPEGLGLFAILCIWAFFKTIRSVKKEFKQKFLIVATSLLILIITIFPYLLALRKIHGRWMLTRKKAVTDLFYIEELIERIKGSEERSENTPNTIKRQGILEFFQHDEGKVIKRTVFKIGELINTFIKTLHYLLFLFFVIGLVKRKAFLENKDGEKFIFLILLFYLIVLSFLATKFYVSRRHVLVLVIPSFYWSAIGFFVLCEWFSKLIRKDKKNKEGKLRFQTIAVYGLIVLLILSFKTFKPQRKDQLAQKRAGIWLKNEYQIKRPIIIVTSLQKVPYYAEGKWLEMPKGKYAGIIKFAKREKAHFMAEYEDKLKEDYKGFLEEVDEDELKLIKIFFEDDKKDKDKDKKSRKLLIFKVKY